MLKDASHKRFLSAEELSDRVPFALNTIRKKTSRREMPFLKIGRKVIYDWDRITEWLSAASVEPCPTARTKQEAN